MSSLTGALVSQVRSAMMAPLPEPVAEHAATLLLNGLATAIGARSLPPVQALVDIGGAHGGRATSPVPGRAERLDPVHAAAATAAASNAHDFDDTHLETVTHPSAVSLAAAIALGAQRRVSGSRLLTAFALGCEAQLRVAAAMSPGHYERGWHITGTCGALGAATAGAVICGLSEQAMRHCLGAAASQTVGHRAAFGTDVKTMHAAKAAANGVLAALLAERGVTGPERPLEGPRGLFAVMAPSGYDAHRVTGGFGDRWEILATAVKPYPCGVVAHPAIEAAENLAPRLGGAPALERVEVWCHPLVPELMGVAAPATEGKARFSAAHAVATALTKGSVGAATYTMACVDDPAVARTRSLVQFLPDERCARDAATVRVRLPGGEVLTEHVEPCRGSPRRPLTRHDVRAKAARLVEPALPGRGGVLAAEVDRLRAAPDLSGLVKAVTPE